MPATHRNRLVTAISNTPSTTGALTIAAAASGYRTFGAGDNGLSFDVSIVDGTDWEIRTGCVYTHSGTSLARGTMEDSSTGSAISLTSAAVVTVTMSAGMGNSTEMVAQVLGKSEVSITGTATATIGRMHICSGTSANYTVTLPAASGNAGKLIGLRMSPSLTKLVTIDGNASEAIDGALTRVMWANEVAILLCDGTSWTKIAGKTVPMACTMYLNAAQTNFTSGAVTNVALDTVDNNNTGSMGNAGSNRIDILRGSVYSISGKAQRAGAFNSAAVPRWLVLLYVNNAQATSAEVPGVLNGYPTPYIERTQSLSAGDYVDMRIYQDSGVTQGCVNGAGKETQIGVVEVPQW